MALQSCVRAGSREGRPGWLLSFDYDAEAIERLKQLVLFEDREWRPDEKRWWVADSERCRRVLRSLWPAFQAFEAAVPLPGLEVP